MKGGFRSQELDGCELMLGFRQVWAARECNTLRTVLCVLSLTMTDADGMMDEMRSIGPLTVPLLARCLGLQVREEIYSSCYMELARLRSLDIRNTHPLLDPDPRRNLPTSSRVPIGRVVVQSGPSRVVTQSGDNYSAGRYPDVPSSLAYILYTLYPLSINPVLPTYLLFLVITS